MRCVNILSLTRSACLINTTNLILQTTQKFNYKILKHSDDMFIMLNMFCNPIEYAFTV